jgi:hypothetical protein
MVRNRYAARGTNACSLLAWVGREIPVGVKVVAFKSLKNVYS